ncbi:MAG: hypothetical protein V1779_00845 [bacterium]
MTDWIMRNITDENRVKDTVDAYKSFGFEVKVEDFDPDKFKIECNECMLETPEKFKVIYTKQLIIEDGDLLDV